MSKINLPQRRLRLAFFGTPQLAERILDAILTADQDDVILVCCQPDKPQGRKKKLQAPPVKGLALSRGIEVIQPKKMRDGSLASLLAEQQLDLAIVVAYGRILTADTLSAIPGGFWNIHTSILPRHRGASPIQHAIWEGDDETGVSLMRMTEGCDEGPVLAISRTRIEANETCTSLSDRLVKLAIDLVLENLQTAKSEGLTETEQDHGSASHARLLNKADGELDFKHSAEAVCRKIRALNPWPGTFVRLENGQALKVLAARKQIHSSEAAPGTVLQTDRTMWVQTAEDVLEIIQVQAPGKRPMPCADYLRGAGRHWTAGNRFGRT